MNCLEVNRIARLPDDQRDMFTDAYRFYERHIETGDTAEDWEACVKDACEIVDKYNQHKFVTSMLLAVYAQLERTRGHSYEPGRPFNE